MARLEVETLIHAPIGRCFQLALSVEAHAASARHTGEQVLGAHGILRLGDTVTFRARHFGVWQTLTSQVTALQAPAYFRDEMRRGAFSWLRHDHYFETRGPATLMRDVFAYAVPLGGLGRVFDRLVLAGHLRRFLTRRGQQLRQLAEGEGWREFVEAASSSTASGAAKQP